MIQRLPGICSAVALALLFGCSRSSSEASGVRQKPALPPEPVVSHTPADAQPGQKIDHGELILDADEARQHLHTQHHPYKVLETRRVPGRSGPAMTDVKDFALSKKDLDVINPGPGEYVHVMEGQRHGYENLTIGITYTAPGGAPPMHTHKGEESHVLLKGQKVLYALGDKLFVEGGALHRQHPPGGAALVHRTWTIRSRSSWSIFPTNVWEYDVLNTSRSRPRGQGPGGEGEEKQAEALTLPYSGSLAHVARRCGMARLDADRARARLAAWKSTSGARIHNVDG